MIHNDLTANRNNRNFFNINLGACTLLKCFLEKVTVDSWPFDLPVFKLSTEKIKAEILSWDIHSLFHSWRTLKCEKTTKNTWSHEQGQKCCFLQTDEFSNPKQSLFCVLLLPRASGLNPPSHGGSISVQAAQRPQAPTHTVGKVIGKPG